MKDLLRLLDQPLAGNDLGHWLAALGITVVLFLAAILVKGVCARRLQAWGQGTRTRVDDALVAVLKDVRLWLVAVIAVWAGSELLALPPKLEAVFVKAAT